MSITNIIPLKAAGGFTRMDNDLYEALIGADLSGRELRIALALHRLTAGFNRDSVKVAALYIAKMMYGDDSKAEAERANVSRAINSLIRQRVIFRDGGSRDPITFLPVSEWKIDPKSTVLKTTHCVENIHATVLKTTHIKDSKYNTTSNEVVTPLALVVAKPAKQAKAKHQAFGLSNLLADNPHAIPEQLLADWLQLRKTKRAAVSKTVWDALNTELTACVAAGITAATAMTEALSAGWHGFKAEWIANRIAGKPQAPSRHSGFDQRDYTAGMTELEDGSYAF
jgi:phage replication O-like protein O